MEEIATHYEGVHSRSTIYRRLREYIIQGGIYVSPGQKRRQGSTRQLEGSEWIALREIIEEEPWLYIDEYQHRMFKSGANYSYTAIRRAFQVNGYTVLGS